MSGKQKMRNARRLSDCNRCLADDHVSDNLRPIPDAHRNRMNHAEKWKADFQFRRKQSLILEAKKLKAGGQTEMRIYLAVRLLGSGWG